ncbi:MAG: hypothetical protein KIT33_05555 [Candidatus Kapabacteria bacterium]|nr:hypothetical protein [Ignavibacteriota bacterium]MCW5884422.1 hypothetical protein [Candidatus Kapabacteria bacterium]
MKKLVYFLFVLLLTGSVFAQTHNPVEGETGSMSTTVITPLSVTVPQSALTFDVIQNQTRTLDDENYWIFAVEGEPGRLVNINFLGPVAVGQTGVPPTLTGQWYGPDEESVQGTSGTYQLPDYPAESFFDVFYELEGIDATGADLGNTTFQLGIEYSYQGL